MEAKKVIATRLEQIEERICAACKRAGRNREDVTLIAVSKTKPVPLLKEVYDCDIRHFGENKVQELTDKYPQLPDDIKWHLIGHLQRNKIKYIIDKVYLIHSVDSIRLAQALHDEATKRGIKIDILLEVNIAEEETKFGFKANEMDTVIDEISKMSSLQVRGLMTIAPYVENPEENRSVFATLRKLSVDIGSKNIDNVSVDILSMGMTNDFEVAIEEGATMVRVGTAIFGERDYSKL